MVVERIVGVAGSTAKPRRTGAVLVDSGRVEEHTFESTVRVATGAEPKFGTTVEYYMVTDTVVMIEAAGTVVAVAVSRNFVEFIAERRPIVLCTTTAQERKGTAIGELSHLEVVDIGTVEETTHIAATVDFGTMLKVLGDFSKQGLG